MGRHAYLIMAHNQFDLLCKLIRELDYELNDIYIHIDKKAGEIDEEKFRTCVKKSKLFFTDRISVTWGGESQIECEMLLFRMAASRKYQYYHILSGVDFPIKTQKEIHEFFDANDGKEFIEYWNRNQNEYLYRIKYYYFLQEKIGTYTYDAKTLMLRIKSKLSLFKQRLMGVDRLKGIKSEIKIGPNWVSITDQMVRYLLEKEPVIDKMFKQGIAADELFVQTLCWNSEFKANIFQGGPSRLIDWTRGKPYVWAEEDFDEIKNSKCLFVRKISNKNHLADMISEQLLR